MPPAADEPLPAALGVWSQTPHRPARAAVLAALVDATVYAAVSATATGEHIDAGTGLRAESGAELAVLLLQASDGARALPVFSDLDQLKRWRLDARPQRLTGAQACAAALDEGAVSVVLDPSGSALALEPDEIRALAQGWVPVPGSSLAIQPPAETQLVAAEALRPLLKKLHASVRGEGLRSARLLQGPDGLVLGVCAPTPLDPVELAAMAQRIVERLGPELPEEGLGLTQVARRGPGQPVLKARFRRTG